MNLLLGHDQTVADWVGKKIGAPMTPPYTAIGFLDRDDVLAVGFVFYGCMPGGNIDIAVAARGMFTRGIIRAVANYVFEQLQARRITVRTPTGNERAISILKRIGFKPEAVCKAYFSESDAMQLRILRSEAKRWLQ